MSYEAVLERALTRAQTFLGQGKTSKDMIELSASLQQQTVRLDEKTHHPVASISTAAAIDTVVSNLNQNKYLFSILATALATKVVSPSVDIRNCQVDMPNSYSNRSTDAAHITPFLKATGLTHCDKSGMESGRNFERPFPLDLSFQAKPRGTGNREAILGLFHAVQVDGANAEDLLTYLFYKDLSTQKTTSYHYQPPQGLTVTQIMEALSRHFKEASGQGKSRLPVLAIQAIYSSMIGELKRFQNMELLPVARHTANDKKGSIGDVQVNRTEGIPFEGVEIKASHSIIPEMILAIPTKLQGNAVDRYYVLSTESECIKASAMNDVNAALQKVRQETGCEVIANGLIPTLRYYLRLIADKDQLLQEYTKLLTEDQDVREPQRVLWGSILAELSPSS
jgi:DNA (cytosine-5)-methyltransferase 1